MEQRRYRTAIITTDGEVRDRVREALLSDSRVEIAVEIETPLSELAESQLRKLREADPELVLLDLSRDPEIGIKFAGYLTDQHGSRRVVGFGPDIGSDALLSAMRAGVSEYLRGPVDAEEFQAAVERALRTLGGATVAARQPGRAYAFFPVKGGVGATTLAVNVAIELHRLTAEPTLLVDLDVELGEAALILGLEQHHTVVDLARNVHRLDPQLLGSFVERHDSGIHVLAAPLYPGAGEAVGAEPVRRLLGFLRQHYAHIVIDTARTTAAHTIAAIERADRVLAVARLDLSSLRNLKRCDSLLSRIRGQDPNRVRILINRYEPAGAITLREVEEALDRPVHRTLIDDREAVARAAADGKPLVLHGSSPLAQQIGSLAAELAGIELDSGAGRSRLIRALGSRIKRLRRRQSQIAGGDRP